jgi:phosphodiesterase/alkaline phosphatase D-like protein
MPRQILTRRELIAAGAVAGATYAAVPPVWGKSLFKGRVRVGPGRFLDGVASGEPTANAITFWSRLTTPRPRSGARLVVARDPGMRRVVATAVVPTGRGIGGALKVRIAGLKPSSTYYYMWESGTDLSPLGRTKTAPDPSSLEALRMTFSSCQQFAAGHFGAHADVARFAPLDAVMFLGDYVYERADFVIREDPLTSLDLASYRDKYAVYRSDPGLRELHRMHPTLHIWDDHELANNYTENSPPTPAVQRAAAYRASFEWLPRLSLPHDRHRIFKRFSFGRVADVFLLDERQYRTGNGDGQPRRFLGDAQLGWLIDGLRASNAKWKLVAQQMQVAPIPFEGRQNDDGWDGYDAERRALLGAIESSGIDNVAFLSGDVHVFAANLLASDFEALGDGSSRRPSAVEYVGGSVTSPGRARTDAEAQEVAPWNLQYNGLRHGYAALDLDVNRLVCEYRAQPVVTPAPQVVAFERFTQAAGSNRPARESFAAPPTSSA